MQTYIDANPYLSIDLRFKVILVYWAGSREVQRVLLRPEGARLVEPAARLFLDNEQFEVDRLVTVSAPGGAGIYAINAAGEHSQVCVFYPFAANGDAGPTTYFDGDAEGLEKVRRYRLVASFEVERLRKVSRRLTREELPLCRSRDSWAQHSNRPNLVAD